MKILIWSAFALLALLWTGAVAATAALLDLAATWTASGAAADAAGAVASLPVPAWLSLWVDTALLHASLDALRWGLEALQQAGPFFAGLMGWLVPLAWVAWAVGMALLLVIAVVGHLVAGRWSRRSAPAPAAA